MAEAAPQHVRIALRQFLLDFRMGGLGLAGGVGVAKGPLLGGWIFDTTGSYGWLYLSSFGMGIGTFMIAMLFRPFPKVSATAPGLVTT